MVKIEPWCYLSYDSVIKRLLVTGCHQTIEYVSEKITIKATRRVYKGKPDKTKIEFQVTHGPPNHREKLAIKRMKRAGVWTNRDIEVR